MEDLGQQGEVDEAQRVMRKIDRLKREKEEKQFVSHGGFDVLLSLCCDLMYCLVHAVI